MQIKIPKVIEVGAHPYTIKYDDELVEEEGLLGKHEHKKLTITIYPNQLPTNKMTTFIHEHLHATSLVFCRDHVPEEMVLGLAEGMTQLFTQLGIEFDWSEVRD